MSFLNGVLGRLLGDRNGGANASQTRDASRHDANAAAVKRGGEVDDRIRHGLEHHQAGEVDLAERAYREALNCAPDNADVHYLLGSLLGASGRLDEALEHLQAAARLDPSAAAARSDTGNVYRVQGRLEEAEAAYRDAIGIDAEFAHAHRNLGDLLNAQGRVDEAIDCLVRASCAPRCRPTSVH